jgi:hypothetical protein
LGGGGTESGTGPSRIGAEKAEKTAVANTNPKYFIFFPFNFSADDQHCAALVHISLHRIAAGNALDKRRIGEPEGDIPRTCDRCRERESRRNGRFSDFFPTVIIKSNLSRADFSSIVS